MDKNNFSDLYSASRKDLYKYCRTLCGNDADDLMQQTYLKAWENFGSFRGENFSFWLRSVARNIFLDNLRKSKCPAEELPEISDNSNNPEFIAEKRDIGRILLKALKDSLSPVQRMTIILYYYDEKSVSEIANIMQVSENTVKSRLFNARKKLREELKKFGNIFTCMSLGFAVIKHKLKNIQIPVNARITVSAVMTAASMALISVSYSPPENKFPDTVITINETGTSENQTTTENKTDIQTSSETAFIEPVSHTTTNSTYTIPTSESHTTAFKSEYEESQNIIPEESEEGDTEKELTEENDIQTEYEEDTTMKKEIIAVTTTAVTAFSSISTMNVRAVDKTESTETTVSEIASSLGADTDYFNFVNYVSNSVKADYIAEFNKNCSDIDNYRGVMPQMTKIAASGHCYGMAVLQVLVHNGIIKPSDIQEGAETIHDIQFDDDVNGIVSYYAATQLYQEKELSDGYYFCNSDHEKQAKDLIEYAERAMQEDKYFVINLSGTKFGHAVVGIGCTDGEWTFNDKIYNKCILTLDSNLQQKDENGNTVAGGFAENTCIYINTEDYNFYIPAYNLSSEDESLYIRGIYDDENFLNYKGCINPNYELEKDISDLTAIEIDNFTLSDYSLTVDGKTYNGTGEEPLDITVNDILTNQFIKSMRKYFVSTADKNIKFSIDEIPENTGTSETQLVVTDTDSYSTLYAEGKFDVDFSENRIETNHEGNIALELVSEKSPYNADWQGEPFNMFQINMTGDFMQNTGTKTAVEINENGFLLQTDGQTDAIITLGNRLETEGGWLDYYRTGLDGKHIFRIICNNDIMFKYNDNSDSFDIYIDDDKDNIFDKKIEQGDIDCNGQADAADASLLLKSYAEFSVKNYPPIYNFSPEFADLDGDGAINAADASLVLQKYAKSATE